MEERVENIRKTYTKVGFAMLSYLLISQFLPMLLVALFKSFSINLLDNGWIKLLILDGAQFGVALPVVLLILKGVGKDTPKLAKHPLTAGKILHYFMLSMGLLYIFNIIGNLLNMLVSMMKGTPAANIVEQGLSGYTLLQIFIMTVVIAPLGEEFLFRHTIYRCVGQYGEKTFILTSALLFMLMHANIVQYPYTLMLGILLAWVYVRSGSIVYSILLHAGINMVGGVLSVLGMQQPIYLIFIMGCYLIGVVYLISVLVKKKNRIKLRNEEPMGKDEVDAVLLNPGIFLFTLGSLLMAGYIILYL